MRVAICQLESRVGDVPANLDRALAALALARDDGAEVCVFPEMHLTGYPPRDLLYRDDLVEAVDRALERLAEASRGMAIVVGAVTRTEATRGGRPLRQNVAVVLADGREQARQAKTLLPCYDVFDEPRWFAPAASRAKVALAGRPAGLLLCEDMWDEGYDVHPPRELLDQGAEVLIALSASPFRVGAPAARLYHARRHAAPLVYVNAVGAEDELIFDGGSFVVDGAGRLLAELPRFEERVETVDLAAALAAGAGSRAPDEREGRDERDEPPLEETLFRALVTGVRSFCAKNGLPLAFLGLSGGVDSALVACIAKEALGARRVRAVAIPSRYSDPRSTEDARALAHGLGVGFVEVPLEAMHAACEGALRPHLGEGEASGVALENVQARLRALALMALVNRHGGILLNTSNKTEAALGYGTLYGDMAGGLAVIGDLSKTWVYRLARWYSEREGGVIPPFTLERPPSAELRPDQVDPFDYPRVAPLVDALIEGIPLAQIAREHGVDREELARLETQIRHAEHKRRQSPIALKVTPVAFGAGRRVPVTNGLGGLARWREA